MGFGGWWVNLDGGGSTLSVGLDMGLSFFFFFFFFFGGLWVVGYVIRGEHGWWSPVWEASLASLLAWG